MVTTWWSLDLISQLLDSQGILILASVADGPKDLTSGKLFQVVARQTQMWARKPIAAYHTASSSTNMASPLPKPTFKILGLARMKPDAYTEGELHKCSCLSPSPAPLLRHNG